MKSQIDAFLEVRKYLAGRIAEVLTPGVDYYEVTRKGKTVKSLGKPGAEKIAAICRFTVPEMVMDKDTMDALRQAGVEEPFVAYMAIVKNFSGDILCVGRGAHRLSAHAGDINKMIKMAQKSAYIDGIIRASGLSDVFTQDLEDMKDVPKKGAPDPQGGKEAIKARRRKPTPVKIVNLAPQPETYNKLHRLMMSPLFTEAYRNSVRALLKKNRTEAFWAETAKHVEEQLKKMEEQEREDENENREDS